MTPYRPVMYGAMPPTSGFVSPPRRPAARHRTAKQLLSVGGWRAHHVIPHDPDPLDRDRRRLASPPERHPQRVRRALALSGRTRTRAASPSGTPPVRLPTPSIAPALICVPASIARSAGDPRAPRMVLLSSAPRRSAARSARSLSAHRAGGSLLRSPFGGVAFISPAGSLLAWSAWRAPTQRARRPVSSRARRLDRALGCGPARRGRLDLLAVACEIVPGALRGGHDRQRMDDSASYRSSGRAATCGQLRPQRVAGSAAIKVVALVRDRCRPIERLLELRGAARGWRFGNRGARSAVFASWAAARALSADPRAAMRRLAKNRPALSAVCRRAARRGSHACDARLGTAVPEHLARSRHGTSIDEPPSVSTALGAMLRRARDQRRVCTVGDIVHPQAVVVEIGVLRRRSRRDRPSDHDDRVVEACRAGAGRRSSARSGCRRSGEFAVVERDAGPRRPAAVCRRTSSDRLAHPTVGHRLGGVGRARREHAGCAQVACCAMSAMLEALGPLGRVKRASNGGGGA